MLEALVDVEPEISQHKLSNVTAAIIGYERNNAGNDRKQRCQNDVHIYGILRGSERTDERPHHGSSFPEVIGQNPSKIHDRY
jgi:hypothetical protein